MKGKPQRIDLITLYAKSNTGEWNEFLSRCLIKQDLKELEKVLYGIQLGMHDLVKKRLNTDKLNNFFLRLQRSIETTIKQIIKEKEPHPLDDPFNKEKFEHLIESKKNRDIEIEKYLRKVRF